MRKPIKRKATKKTKLAKRTYIQGSGEYAILGKTKTGILKKADRIEKIPGVNVSRPKTRKVKF